MAVYAKFNIFGSNWIHKKLIKNEKYKHKKNA